MMSVTATKISTTPSTMRSVSRSPKTTTPKKEGRKGFQRTEDRRGRGADGADGGGHRHQRHDRRKERQRDGVDPESGRGNRLQVGAEAQAHDIDAQAEQQGVKVSFSVGRPRSDERLTPTM